MIDYIVESAGAQEDFFFTEEEALQRGEELYEQGYSVVIIRREQNVIYRSKPREYQEG